MFNFNILLGTFVFICFLFGVLFPPLLFVAGITGFILVVANIFYLFAMIYRRRW